MNDTALVLATIVPHLGVPLADLVAWALLLAFLAVPAPHQTLDARIPEFQSARLFKLVARRPDGRRPAIVVVPAPSRLSVADQWQAVTRVVAEETERAIAVASDHRRIGRDLDSLDLTLENLRRELAAVMTVALPPVSRTATLVTIPLRRARPALAA